MGLKKRINYEELSDKEIVELILVEPHNEEAAYYLLSNRYYTHMCKLYFDILKEFSIIVRGDSWLDDCINDLFLHLRGCDGEWNVLKSFEWRSSFRTWIKRVADRKFKETLYQLIENSGLNVSIDSNDPEKPPVQLPDGGGDTYERRELKVLLLEAIGQLKDDDQRFVILKRIQGYHSKEIAILLQKKWQKHGIKKYNKNNELIIPDVGYVNVHTQRAKINLRKIICELK